MAYMESARNQWTPIHKFWIKTEISMKTLIFSFRFSCRNIHTKILGLFSKWKCSSTQAFGFYTTHGAIVIEGAEVIYRVAQNMFLGTIFTNAIYCFQPGPQEPYREFVLKHHVYYVFTVHRPRMQNKQHRVTQTMQGTICQFHDTKYLMVSLGKLPL
jgi:hypothetical protein